MTSEVDEWVWRCVRNGHTVYQHRHWAFAVPEYDVYDKLINKYSKLPKAKRQQITQECKDEIAELVGERQRLHKSVVDRIIKLATTIIACQEADVERIYH